MDILENSSIKRLLTSLLEELRILVAKEFDLAKAEMTNKASAFAKNAVAVIIGAAVIYAGVLVLLAAAVFGLATVVAAWLSALIIGGVVTLGGVIAALGAMRNLKRIKIKPEHTVASLRQDKKWLKSEVEA